MPNHFLAQELSKKITHKVYRDLIDAIGNTHPREPALEIKNTKRNPASYNPNSKIITIEKKLLAICYSFGSDSLNALSYILAHELGHHYRDHGWEAQYASLDFSNETNKKQEKIEQKKDDETEADIYAGFYSHIAGYDALSVAEEFLNKVYSSYNLPEDLPGYPTLDQRKNVIKRNLSDFNNLKYVFDAANIAMILGHYTYAQELFTHVLNKDFTSREIYNNLGLCYVYDALSLDIESDFNILIPFKIDLSSRLESKPKTRGNFTTNEKAIQLFKKAIKEFEDALRLDPNYLIAKQNIFYSKIALHHLGEEISTVDTESVLEIEGICKNCINGHQAIIKNKLRKAKGYFKKGSRSCNVCDVNTNFKKRVLDVKKISNNESGGDDFVNGIDMYCLDFSSSDCDFYEKLTVSKLCVKELEEMNLIMIKRRLKGVNSCISIQEINQRNEIFRNNLNLYVGDDASNIFNNHQVSQVFDSGKGKYITILNEGLAFLISDDKIIKWYIAKKLD